MRRLRCEEVQFNGGKRSKCSRPDASPLAANIKKARKGEVNFLPNMPQDHDADALESCHTWMLSKMEKSAPDLTKVNKYMSLTFVFRCKEVTQDLALVGDVTEGWPLASTVHSISGTRTFVSSL